MPSMRAEVWLPARVTVAVTADTRNTGSFRESATALFVGYRGGLERGR